MEVSYVAYFLALVAVVAIVTGPLTITGNEFVKPGQTYTWITDLSGNTQVQGIYFTVKPKYNITLSRVYVNSEITADSIASKLYLFDSNTFPDATAAGDSGQWTDIGCTAGSFTGVEFPQTLFTDCNQFLLEDTIYTFYATLDGTNRALVSPTGATVNSLWTQNNALEVYTSYSSSADFTVVETPLYNVNAEFNYTRIN